MSLYIGDKKYCAVMKVGVNNQDIIITENGNYTPDEGYSGFGVVRVNLPEPIYDEITIDPKVVSQTHTPLNDGFSKVIVNPVTSAIDSDIQPENIKKGVEILGVTGIMEFTTEELVVNPTTELQEKYPAEDGYSKVTINPVTNDIDENIQAGNILKGVEILGVVGTVIESNNISTRNITANGTFSAEAPYTGFSSVVVDVKADLRPITIDPQTHTQTFAAPDEYTGYAPITVNPVTAAIDPDIIATNIRKGVNILGVDGSIDFETLTVNPSTDPQEFTPTKDGYSKVTVGAVTAAIDEDIKPENIMGGVNILGVDGAITFEELLVTPSTEQQELLPDTNGFSRVVVAAVGPSIDSDIIAENIKKGINILGVNGTLEFTTEELTVTPTTAVQTFTPDANGYSLVTVNPVSSTIDGNISAENIKEGVTILGVTGTFKYELEDLTITPTTSVQQFNSEKDGYNTITVNGVTAAIDSNIKAGNIKSGVEILGVTGTCAELIGQTKTITENGTFTPDEGYTALTSVTVNVDTVNNEDLNITENGTYTPSQGHTGFGSVTVNVDTVRNQTKTFTENGTFTPDQGYTGFGSVTIDVVSAVNKALNITPSGTAQTFVPEEGYTGFNPVTVAAISADVDPNIIPANIVKGVTILGVTGNAELALQEKHVTIGPDTPTITTYTPDQDGCNGYSKFIFDLTWLEEQLAAINAGDTTTAVSLQNKTVTASGTYTCDANYDGLGTVTVDVSAYELQIADLQAQVAALEAQLQGN